MPFVLIIIGSAMVIASARGTQGQLATQLAKDFSGSSGFLTWITALLMLGLLGYVPQLKRFSDGLIFLVLLSFLLSNTGVWSQLSNASTSPPASLAEDPTTIPSSSSSGSGSVVDAGLALA